MNNEKYDVKDGVLEIEVLQWDDQDLMERLRPFMREKGMSWGNPPGTQWLFGRLWDTGALLGRDAGVVALSVMNNGTLRCKSDVVLKEYRGRGVYRALSDYRMMLARDSDASKVSAYAGPLSEGQFLKDGFKVQSRSRGVAYLIKAL